MKAPLKIAHYLTSESISYVGFHIHAGIYTKCAAHATESAIYTRVNPNTESRVLQEDIGSICLGDVGPYTQGRRFDVSEFDIGDKGDRYAA
jgi:hypothetical protein